MKEDNIAKVRRLMEEFGGDPDSVEIKQHSIFFKHSCPNGFYSKYIRQCKGVVAFTNSLGGFSIHKWGTHIGVPVKRTYAYATFISIAFDVKNNIIKINTRWDNNSPLIEDVGKFKPEVFKELYETIPEFLKSRGIYDYKESRNDDVLTLNIITNIPAKLEKRIRTTGRFINYQADGIVKLNDGLEFTAISNSHKYLVRILYKDSENSYSIQLTEQENGLYQQSESVREADLLYTLDDMLKSRLW